MYEREQLTVTRGPDVADGAPTWEVIAHAGGGYRPDPESECAALECARTLGYGRVQLIARAWNAGAGQYRYLYAGYDREP